MFTVYRVDHFQSQISKNILRKDEILPVVFCRMYSYSYMISFFMHFYNMKHVAL
jgi:hypothetical protein